jgi:hypothetical protein
MVNYQNGKIYKICSDNTDKVYIGSTCVKYLSQRLQAHLEKYKEYINLNRYNQKYSSFEILECGDYRIELIENHPCNSKDELHKREGYFIKELNSVNKNIAGRKRQQRYIEDKDRILKQQKKYEKKNKEIISAKRSVKKECDICGSFVSKRNMARHLKLHSQ